MAHPVSTVAAPSPACRFDGPGGRIPAQRDPAKRERAIAKLELEQHGLLTRAQLREVGLSDNGVRRRRTGARHNRLASGVFANPAVGRTFEQRVMGAVLAGGDGAFASHESALRVWDFPPKRAALLEITTGLKRRPRVAGVRCHRSGHESDVTVVDGIRVSTPERTIIDLSGRYNLKMLGRMIDDALRSVRKMLTLLDRRDAEVGDRESLLEDFVDEAIARFRLPPPVPQHRVVVDGRERRIDLSYPEEMLALEAKGFDRHRERERFDDDALRGNELRLLQCATERTVLVR